MVQRKGKNQVTKRTTTGRPKPQLKWVLVSVYLVTPRHFSVLFFSIAPLTNVGRQGRLVLTRIPQLGIRTPESTKMADTKTSKFSRFSLTRQVYQKIRMRSSNFAFFHLGTRNLSLSLFSLRAWLSKSRYLSLTKLWVASSPLEISSSPPSSDNKLKYKLKLNDVRNRLTKE